MYSFSSFLGPFRGGGGGKTKFCGQEFYGHPDFSHFGPKGTGQRGGTCRAGTTGQGCRWPSRATCLLLLVPRALRSRSYKVRKRKKHIKKYPHEEWRGAQCSPKFFMWVAPSPSFSRRRGPHIKNFRVGSEMGMSGAFLYVYVLFFAPEKCHDLGVFNLGVLLPHVGPAWTSQPSNRERKLNTIFFFSSFSGASGISRQNPGISRPKSLISLVARDVSSFLAPTRSRGRPLPTGKYPDQKVWVWVLFSSLIQTSQKEFNDDLKITWKMIKGAQTMKCKLWTETLEFSRLKVPNSRFALHGLAPP